MGIIQWVDKSDRASISGLTVSISVTQVALAAFYSLDHVVWLELRWSNIDQIDKLSIHS